MSRSCLCLEDPRESRERNTLKVVGIVIQRESKMTKKLIVTLSDETNQLFRDTCKKLYGEKVGGLSIGAEQALKEWIERNNV